MLHTVIPPFGDRLRALPVSARCQVERISVEIRRVSSRSRERRATAWRGSEVAGARAGEAIAVGDGDVAYRIGLKKGRRRGKPAASPSQLVIKPFLVV